MWQSIWAHECFPAPHQGFNLTTETLGPFVQLLDFWYRDKIRIILTFRVGRRDVSSSWFLCRGHAVLRMSFDIRLRPRSIAAKYGLGEVHTLRTNFTPDLPQRLALVTLLWELKTTFRKETIQEMLEAQRRVLKISTLFMHLRDYYQKQPRAAENSDALCCFLHLMQNAKTVSSTPYLLSRSQL